MGDHRRRTSNGARFSLCLALIGHLKCARSVKGKRGSTSRVGVVGLTRSESKAARSAHSCTGDPFPASYADLGRVLAAEHPRAKQSVSRLAASAAASMQQRNECRRGFTNIARCAESLPTAFALQVNEALLTVREI